MPWKLHTISSGYCSLDNEELDPDFLPQVFKALKRKLGARMSFGGRLGLDLSAAAAELSIDGARITVGWDNWSGAFIMAWDSKGDRIIKNEITDIFIKNS
ncbi:MAG: hypothetical protein K2J80_03085 [Oscillospiraceae bacterium]|nr:hypothetical protein [Oscillospiraceae bacterium]